MCVARDLLHQVAEGRPFVEAIENIPGMSRNVVYVKRQNATPFDQACRLSIIAAEILSMLEASIDEAMITRFREHYDQTCLLMDDLIQKFYKGDIRL